MAQSFPQTSKAEVCVCVWERRDSRASTTVASVPPSWSKLITHTGLLSVAWCHVGKFRLNSWTLWHLGCASESHFDARVFAFNAVLNPNRSRTLNTSPASIHLYAVRLCSKIASYVFLHYLSTSALALLNMVNGPDHTSNETAGFHSAALSN